MARHMTLAVCGIFATRSVVCHKPSELKVEGHYTRKWGHIGATISVEPKLETIQYNMMCKNLTHTQKLANIQLKGMPGGRKLLSVIN